MDIVPAIASLLPSAEDAIIRQVKKFGLGGLFDVQLVPEFVEVYNRFPDQDSAANLLPSADEATAYQVPKGTLFVIQVAPAFVEV